MTLAQRFHAKVWKHDAGCWEWIGSKQPTGYAQLWNGQRVEQAHRISFRLTCGAIPDGMEIDHLCRNRGCVNPDHLQAVSHRENMRRSKTIMGQNAAKTECKRGHSFDQANTYITANGARQCRACLRMHAKNRKARARG